MNKKANPTIQNETEIQKYLLSLEEIEEIRFANHSIHEYKGQDIVQHSEDVSEFIVDSTARKFLTALAGYIKDPMIIDIFTREENRTRFEKHLKEVNYPAYKFLMRNRLRLNRISRVTGILRQDELFEISSDSKSKLRWINNQLKGNTQNNLDYFELPTKKKVFIVHQFTYLARQAYDEIVDNL